MISMKAYADEGLVGKWKNIFGGGPCSIEQPGPQFTLTNEIGQVARGYREIVAEGWGDLIGTLEASGTQIHWNNNTAWARPAAANNLDGDWFMQNDPGKKCTIRWNDDVLEIVNENGNLSRGHLNIVAADGWPEKFLVGRLSKGKILWRNNSAWMKTEESMTRVILKTSSIRCEKVSEDEGALDGKPGDEFYMIVGVKSPRGLVGPFPAIGPEVGPFRIPRSPIFDKLAPNDPTMRIFGAGMQGDDYIQMQRGWYTDRNGWLGVDDAKHNPPVLLDAILAPGEEVNVDVLFAEQDGKIEVRKIGFKIENGKFRITDFDVAKGQDDFLGSVHAMIRNKDGVIETSFTPGNFTSKGGNRGRPNTMSVELRGSGADYFVEMEWFVSTP